MGYSKKVAEELRKAVESYLDNIPAVWEAIAPLSDRTKRFWLPGADYCGRLMARLEVPADR